ncbi:SH3 domain-containing protein [Virgibacillus profundi]|nr:SH3 domain-containing protein [Virgibacillus profundi]
MNKGKGLIVGILTILIAAFIVFVVIMQNNFNNPEFAQSELGKVQISSDEENTDKDSNDMNQSTNTTESADDTDEENTEEESVTHSTRNVTVEILNVRSGPGVDYDIAGVVTIDQELEVEDSGDEWVEVTTDEFSGYVNEKYLSEE